MGALPIHNGALIGTLQGELGQQLLGDAVALRFEVRLLGLDETMPRIRCVEQGAIEACEEAPESAGGCGRDRATAAQTQQRRAISRELRHRLGLARDDAGRPRLDQPGRTPGCALPADHSQGGRVGFLPAVA